MRRRWNARRTGWRAERRSVRRMWRGRTARWRSWALRGCAPPTPTSPRDRATGDCEMNGRRAARAFGPSQPDVGCRGLPWRVEERSLALVTRDLAMAVVSALVRRGDATSCSRPRPAWRAIGGGRGDRCVRRGCRWVRGDRGRVRDFAVPCLLGAHRRVRELAVSCGLGGHRRVRATRGLRARRSKRRPRVGVGSARRSRPHPRGGGPCVLGT